MVENEQKVVATDKRKWILAALMMTMMLAAMDSTIVATAIPHIVSDLGGFSKFSWVFSIYLLAQTVTIPIYGKLTDVFGRKKILIGGILLFLLGSATCATAWNITSLIVFRGLQGLGAGSIMATVNTIAGDIYTVEERAKVQGYLSSIWGISAILGPAIGGAFAEYVDWRWIFLINLPIGTVSLFLITTFFKEKVEKTKTIIDFKGAFLILLTLSLLFVFLLESGQSWRWISSQSLILLLVIIVFVFLTIRTEMKSSNAIMPLWVWKNKTFAFTNLAMVGMGIVMMGPDTLLPMFCQSSLSLGTILSGFILASMSFGWPVASAYSGKLYMKIGFKETSIIGAIVLLVSSFGFLLIPHPQPVYLLIINQVLLGAGFGLLSTPALVGIQSMVGWKDRGVVTSTNIFSRNLGQSVGAAIMGAIFNNSLFTRLQSASFDVSNESADILRTLQNVAVSEESKIFLRNSINISMHYVYWGMAFFAAIIVFVLLRIPHRNPKDFSTIVIEK